MAAPEFRSVRLVTAAVATSATFEVPAGAAAGDRLEIGIKVEDDVITIGLPTGGQTWNPTAEQAENTAEHWTCAVFELPNWNGTDTSYTVAWGGGSDGRKGAICSHKGCDTTTPRNATSGAAIKKITASTNCTVDGYTTTVNECLRVSWVFNNDGLKVTNAAEWTEDADQTDSPQLCHKTAAVNAGEQAAVVHTLGSAKNSMTLGYALQPPQAATIKPASLLLGVG